MNSHSFRKTLIHALLVPAIGLGLSASAGAADDKAGSNRTASSAQKEEGKGARQQSGDMRASQIIGMKVKNAGDEHLGKIDDLIIDTANQRAAYAVLSFGGMMGMGDKLFAYPLGAFQPGKDGRELVLNLDKEKLAKAPGFEKKHWPDWNKEDYRGEVDRHFGPAVSPKALPNQRLARASELLDKKVTDDKGKKIGEMEDMVVNLRSGRIHFAVLEFDKGWLSSDKLIPLSMKSLVFPHDDKGNISTRLTRNEIDTSHGFDKNRWPDLGDSSWQRDVSAGIDSGVGAAGPRGEERDRDRGSMSDRERDSGAGRSSSGSRSLD